MKRDLLSMKYKDYSAEDFANDSFFIRWVNSPDAESDWFWQSFIKENPVCQLEIERARALISWLDFPEHRLNVDEVSSMRNQLLMTLRAEKEEHREKLAERTLKVWRSPALWLRVAAAILIIPLASFGLYRLIQGGDKKPLAKYETHAALEQRINPPGQKSVLFLSDGSKVWLNAASQISYAKDFREEKTRDVYLHGEAFFDVAHDAKKPFVVHTSSIKIKVLGTSFNVKSYPEEKTIETTLVQGAVRIEQADEHGKRIGDIELKPSQRAVFDKHSKVINIREVAAENSGSWKEERLVFDGASIDDVILQMERWYNVKIFVGNRGSLNCKLTASIENESLEEVLKLMEASHDIRYTISGREVFIEGSLCAGGNGF